MITAAVVVATYQKNEPIFVLVSVMGDYLKKCWLR